MLLQAGKLSTVREFWFPSKCSCFASWGNKSRFVSLVKGRGGSSGFLLFSPWGRRRMRKTPTLWKNHSLDYYCCLVPEEGRSRQASYRVWLLSHLLYLTLSSSYLAIVWMGKMKYMRRKTRNEEGSDKIRRQVIRSWVLGRQKETMREKGEKNRESENRAGKDAQV